MKKITLIAILAGAFALLVLPSYYQGYATKKSQGITTAPGDLTNSSGVKQTCAKCHNSNNFSPSSTTLTITDANNNPIAGYQPGATL